ncbi:MAG: LPS assembly lipoprotein LptE [Arcobacteraceae bacterium]|jgi:hypothetical protein|nr:LPS assembly lipoprotein LptE [Arcobacteraceae bacterium]
MKKSLILIILFFLVGCGYKPVTHYTKEQIYGLVYLTSITSLENPQNSVILQDNVARILISNLDLELTDNKNLADTIVTVSIGTPYFKVVEYNTQGYVKTYRAKVSVELIYQNEQTQRRVSSNGEYDFSVGSVSTISDTERFNAIKQATSKALEDILGKIAVQSFKK